ncbi:MAG TPA: heavy metal translocating P-type ATPase [Feifaniaceae bacterium]|nr:heavy metal translocating P-type ATPase [Feifaniaceae bacterium]
MAKDWIGTNGKCKYCGMDEAHCACGKTERETCNITCNDESCSCGHAHEHEEQEHGGEGARKFIAIGVAAALLVASYFSGDTLAIVLRLLAYLAAGYEVLLRAGKGLFKRRFFDENVLMSIATIGAVALGDYAEAAAVMIFYGVGESLQETAVRSSRKRITDAVELHPDKARLLNDGAEKMVKPEQVSVGETILVKVGERIPLDGVVTVGESLLDVSMLTGEPRPALVKTGSAVSAGSVNTSGPLTIRVTSLAAESSTSRLLRAVEDATKHKPAIERFITRFSRVYTPVVIAAAALLAVLPPLFGAGSWSEWIHRALIFLVISCPCALVLSIPLTFFAGLAITSKNGVLFKGADALERLTKIGAVVLDKTGTLTEGEFEVQRVASIGMDKEELLALASAAEQHSLHPIASAIAKADRRGYTAENIREIAGKGVLAEVNGRRVAVGSRALLEQEGVYADSDASVLIAVDGAYAGAIYVGDRIRETAKLAIEELYEEVGYTAILTGDAEAAAKAVGKQVDVDEVFAALQPADKLRVMREIRAKRGKTLFVGDGINDAPVLAGADIGIAMGLGGTDMAAEAADALLLTRDLTRIPFAISTARMTVSTARTNIVIALVIKTVALILGALGLAGMWMAVVADVGAAIICVLHTLLLFAKTKENKRR